MTRDEDLLHEVIAKTCGELAKVRTILTDSGTCSGWANGLDEPVSTMARRVVERLRAFERELARLSDAAPSESGEANGPVRTYTLADGSTLLLHRETPHRVMRPIPRVEGGGVWAEVTRIANFNREMQIHAQQIEEEWKARK